MPRLTERGVAAAKARERVYRLSDGKGLLLEVRTAGGKAWLFRFMLQGRRRNMGFGSYPAIGLAAARRKAAEAAQLVEAGQDPITQRKDAERIAAAEKADATVRRGRTFRDVAERLVKAQSPG